MGTWFDALKKSENTPMRNPQNPQNLPGSGFEGFEGSSSERSEKIRTSSGEVSRVSRVPPQAKSGNLHPASRVGSRGSEGFESVHSRPFEQFSPVLDATGQHGPGGGGKRHQVASKKSEIPLSANRQSPRNRTGVGFEGFVGSFSEQIRNFSLSSAWDDDDWQAAFDERAAILEYDAGLPRAEAERIARAEVFQAGGGAR